MLLSLSPTYYLKVFNTGVEAIKLSVDLWIYYLEFLVSKYEDDEEFIRDQFNRSIEDCGLEFRSDKLWELYITWETKGKYWKNVTALYEKLLYIPVCKYSQHWQRFQEHLKKHTPSVVISADEYLELHQEVLAELNRSESAVPDEAPPGEDLAAPEDGQASANQDEEAKMISAKIIESREKIHDITVMMAKDRWDFEDAIKRPYFHVKPLEKSQLNAWRCYIDFEIKEGDEKRTKVLFERCLIACAFYEEFWMKFIRYLEDHNAEEDELRSVFIRACTIHLKEKLKPHLIWAGFEEERGHPDTALGILVEVQNRMDLSLEAYMMSVSIYRRMDDLDAAENIFTNCLLKFMEQEDKNLLSSLLIKYARFLIIFRGNCEKALKTLEDGIDCDHTSHQLLIALADTAMALKPPKIKVACEAFKTGTGKHFPPSVRVMFAYRHLHFVTECSSEKGAMREALALLRTVQRDINQERLVMDEIAKGAADSPYANVKQQKVSSTITNVPTTGTAAVTATATDKTSAAAVNGSACPTSTSNQNYQNYNQNYGAYNQYQQAYGTNGQYPQWGYSNQQGYGYNQQGWGGNYSNYYGQR